MNNSAKSNQPQSKKYDYLAKLVIVGDSSVGKTNILLRFTEDNFRVTHNSTIGVDFKIKTLEVGGKKIKFTLWDTAGQDRFRTITSNYYKGSNGVIFTYSVSDRNSYHNIENWMRGVQENINQKSCYILVGNKCDLPERQRKVSIEEGKQLAQKLGIPFMEVSAKDNIRINELFLNIGGQIKEQIEKQELDNESLGKISIRSLQHKPAEKKKNCC